MQEVEVEVTRVVEVEGETIVEVETIVEEVAITAVGETIVVTEPRPDEPAEEPAEEPAQPEPTSLPTLAPTVTPPPAPATAPPTPAPSATPQPTPVEPFPLRQVFPETLYWDAEALTDENGYLALDLPLADNVTTWRLTALASTQDGELGVTAYDIVVFQDLFIDFSLPATISQGERVTVTVTLYNYSPQSQAVWVEPTPDLWYDLVSPPPQTLTLPPNDVATTSFVIRADRLGTFSLQVATASERASDAVVRDVT
ncbi:MAG: hypothetical protein GY842_18590, partial [bacterium]|nr:hypothetical protein [bacterium]